MGCAYTGVAAFYAHRNRCPFFFRVSSDTNVEPFRESWWRLHKLVDRVFLDYGLRHANAIFAQTEYQRKLLQARLEKDATVIRNFHPAPAESVQKADNLTILWVANLKPLKNPLAFVRLAKRLAHHANIRFLMIGGLMGTPEWNDEVLAQMADAQNLEYLGPKSQEEVNRLLGSGHILVNTSDYEGFSNTFVQAWQRSVPVVSLAVNPDGLLDGTGLGLACDRDEELLLRNVTYLTEDEGARRTMGEYGRVFAQRHHSESNADVIASSMGLEPIGVPRCDEPEEPAHRSEARS